MTSQPPIKKTVIVDPQCSLCGNTKSFFLRENRITCLGCMAIAPVEGSQIGEWKHPVQPTPDSEAGENAFRIFMREMTGYNDRWEDHLTVQIYDTLSVYRKAFKKAIIAMGDASTRNDEVAQEKIGSYHPSPIHDSDCALHNEPAYPSGTCDCSVSRSEIPDTTTLNGWLKAHISLPIKDEYHRGWNNAMEACLMYVGSPEPVSVDLRQCAAVIAIMDCAVLEVDAIRYAIAILDNLKSQGVEMTYVD